MTTNLNDYLRQLTQGKEGATTVEAGVNSGPTRRGGRRGGDNGIPKIDLMKFLKSKHLHHYGIFLIGISIAVSTKSYTAGQIAGWIGLLMVAARVIRGNKDRWPNLPATLAWFTGMILACGLVALVLKGASIYITVGNAIGMEAGRDYVMGANWLESRPAVGPLLAWPVRAIGGWLNGLDAGLMGIVFFVGYVMITFFEIAPVIFEAHPAIMERYAKVLEAFRPMDSKNSASADIVAKRNNYYASLMPALGKAQWLAYLVDFTVILLYTFWVRDAWNAWQAARFTFTLTQAPWIEIAQVGILLGGVWAFCKVAVVFWKGYVVLSGRVQ